jgi:HK97 family phage prohead protease
MEKNVKQQLNFKTYGALSTKALDTAPTGEGVIQIEGYASKSYDNGKPVVDYDGELVDISGFDLTTCDSLLFNHNGNEIKVGKCRLEHRPDGAYLYGEVHEKLNDKVYYAVKHGIMTDFSIGFSATDYEYKTIEGEDVLTFTKGFVWETSIVNVRGANPKAKIETTKAFRQDKKALELAKWLGDTPREVTLDKYTEVKSIIENGKCIGFSCEIEQLKKANPTQNCSCLTKDMDTSTSERVTEITTEEANNAALTYVKEYWKLGPEKASPLPDANSEYWQNMALVWNISEDEARRRLCANCEYYDNTPEAMKEMDAIPINEYDKDGGGRGYCHKFDFICHNLRTCQAWEKKEFINIDEEGHMEKKKDIVSIIKGLTFEETENDNWNQMSKLRYYMEILEETISDNFYETMWYEGITSEEAKANIISALQAFTGRLDEFSLLKPTPTEDEVITKQKRDEEMHIKSNEGADVVTTEATEDKILEGEELGVNPEQEVVIVPEQTSDNEDSTEPSEVAETAVEEIVTEEVKTEEAEPEKLNVEYLSTVDLNGLSAEEIEDLYNQASELVDSLMSDDKVRLLASASDILDKIEAIVAEDIQ